MASTGCICTVSKAAKRRYSSRALGAPGPTCTFTFSTDCLLGTRALTIASQGGSFVARLDFLRASFWDYEKPILCACRWKVDWRWSRQGIV